MHWQKVVSTTSWNTKQHPIPETNKTGVENASTKTPPYCKSVQTKIGKLFLKLLDKHVNKQHEFHKVLNRNNVKISYCCDPNISTIKKIENNKEEDKSLQNKK